METPKTTPIINSEEEDDLNHLFDLNSFLEYTKNQSFVGSSEPERAVFHRKFYGMVKSAIDKYEKDILEALDDEKCSLDEKHALIIQATLEGVGNMTPDVPEAVEFRNKASRAINVVLFELKNLFEDVVNRWMKFYIKEFWIMLELGITEFATMDKYVQHQIIAGSNKLNSRVIVLKELLTQFIQVVSRKVTVHSNLDWSKDCHSWL
jgi:hypothetical protein